MPNGAATSQVYQASVNPSRRAKSTATILPSPPLDSASFAAAAAAAASIRSHHHHHHPSAGSTASLPDTATSANTMANAQSPTASANPAPAKRGRKPGPLSRSARETQRKLNHSIIEKARRTKINDALAELRRLVPVGYAKASSSRDAGEHGNDCDEDGGEGDGDDDGEFSPKRKVAQGKGKDGKDGAGGKKEEKEFKLEILERTVGYLKEVIERVNELEMEVKEGEKRKRSQEHESTQDRPTKKRFVESPAHSTTSSEDETRSRLPPISSWLPLTASRSSASRSPPVVDPLFMPSGGAPRSTSTSPRALGSYLPSPPSSAQFHPTHVHRTIGAPPKLNLSGPSDLVSPVIQHRTTSSSSSFSSCSAMTPEDEFAASSLLGLQIGMERRRRSGSLVGSYDTSGLRSTSARDGEREVKAQTPASLLGLIHCPIARRDT